MTKYSPATLQAKSKEELITLIQQLCDDGDLESRKKNNKSKKKKEGRPMDWSKIEQRKIALQYSYLGHNYCGNAWQPDNPNTIEQKLIDALLKVKLLNPEKMLEFSRSGRTDKGVSAMRNVAVFYLRYATNIDYIRLLNKNLPDDIRVTAWCQVDPSFDARFSCQGRVYKYFFVHNNKNIEKMRLAASFLEGTHDFRNFCKLNVTDTIKFERTIIYCKIQPAECGLCVPIPSKIQEYGCQEKNLWEIEICGRSFLWHMVRSIAAVLFLIGEEKEDPNIVKDLLDIEKYPARPQYQIASEASLLFYDCLYDGIEWNRDLINCCPNDPYNSIIKLDEYYKDSLETEMIRVGMLSTMLHLGVYNMKVPYRNELNSDKIEWNLWCGMKQKVPNQQSSHKYKSLKNIPTTNSVDRELERVNQRKRRRIEDNQQVELDA